jgi:hypothetical protein
LPINLLELGQIQRIGKWKPTHWRPDFLMGNQTQVIRAEDRAFVSMAPVKFSIALKEENCTQPALASLSRLTIGWRS